MHFKKHMLPKLQLLLLLLACSFMGKAQTPRFIIGTADNLNAATVAIPVTVQNFNQIVAIQGTISWDNSKLNFSSITNAASQLAGLQVNASTAGGDGRLSYVWVDNNLNAQSLPNNTVLFTINFNIVSGAFGNTNISFGSIPTQLLVAGANGSPINNITYTNGYVGFVGLPSAPQLIIGTIAQNSQTTVTVPVTTRNFIQYIGLQGSINWDTTKVRFASLSNIHPTLQGLDFQRYNSATNTTGGVSFLWLNDTLQPQNISDNAVLFNLVFNVVSGATGNATLAFTNEPTTLLLTNAQGTAASNITTQNGTIALQGGTLPPTFTIASRSHVSDSTIALTVKVNNFSQLLAMQGSIQWDNTKMQLINVTQVHSTISNTLFNGAVNGTIGTLSYLWTDDNLTAQSISNNQTVFVLNFRVTPATSGLTFVSFNNNPTSLVVSNASSDVVPNVVYNRGIVTFSAPMCLNGTTTITSDIQGATYQWQRNTGTGFVNITNGSAFTGVNTPTLTLLNVPSTSGGHTYRCLVNGNFSTPYEIVFTNYWIGGTSTAWELPTNWSCGVVPDRNTEVVLSPRGGNNPVINTNVIVKKIFILPGINLTVLPGMLVTILGQP
jgi:hypothetical protein